ncbi:ImmA/IrrE family metallo-endopeptidase [Myxococcus sp. Y35]|uniref:ImmA/IrrE family metallo-endopeptidase n=1 Tax=Pseudomyxococcus flavus TaxID=3115648 RepID=UPI003CF04A32
MMGHWLDVAMTSSGLRRDTTFPRDIATEAQDALSVELIPIPMLTTSHVTDWLRYRGVRRSASDTERELYGCMVARAGSAFLFHDTGDTEAEQRFTIAHEVAHFVLDHLLPRERAIHHFGEGILPVINGQRRASLEERLSSVLGQVPLGVQIKLMDRNPSGHLPSGAIAEAERRADRLAFELLAPAEHARPLLQSAPDEEGPALLARHFGIPEDKARGYARLLKPQKRTQPFSIIQFLGEERT